jgi:hypothetical protein
MHLVSHAAKTALLALLAQAVAFSANAAPIKIPEGTEFPLRLEEAISSKTATEGDRFTVSLADDVKLPDGTVLRAGYRGVGEVIEARENGMLGKTGKLGIRINYLRIGDERIRLRANKGAKGDTRTGTQVVSVLLLWPVAPFIKGKNTSIKKGSALLAFTDSDVELEGPIPPPPPEL